MDILGSFRLTPSPACDRMMEATTMSKPSRSNDKQYPHRPQSSLRREGPSQGPRSTMGPRKPDVVCPARERTMLATQADRIETGVRSVMRRVESDQDGFLKLIQTAMTAQVREATIAVETQQGRVIDGAEKAICDAELGVTRILESITQKTQIQMESERSEIERLVHTVTLKAQTRLDAAVLDLDQIKTQVGRDTGRLVTKAVDDLDKSLSLLGSGAISITDGGRKEDKPLTSREAAMKHTSFQVQFRDGPRPSADGDGDDIPF